MRIAEAFVELRVDRKQAEADAKKAATGALDAMRNVFAAGVVIAGLNKAVQDASDLNETISKTKVIFGESQRSVEAWSQSSAQALGISQRAALDAASTFATFAKSAGLAGDDLSKFSTDLVGLSSDLASFYNTSPEQAIEAIGAALRGESEPIRQYGVLLDDATLKARAFEMGLYDGTGALEQSARVMAAQAEIVAQTSDAAGDFARTADGLANSQRIAAAEAENASASFGEVLIPVYDKALEVVTFLVKGFGELPAPLQTTVIALAGLVAFSGPIGTVKDVVQSLVNAFKAASISATTMSVALGAAGAAIGAAIIAYQVYNQRKKEAEQRTLDLRDALLLEAGAQNEALAALAENDDGAKRFLETMQALGLSTEEVAEYMREGTGPAADLAAAYEAAYTSADGTYPILIALGESLGISTEESFEAAAAARDLASELQRLREAEVERQQTQELITELSGQQTEVTENLTVASDDLAATTEDVAKVQKDAADAERDRRDAIAELYDTMLGIIDAQRNYERAVDDVESAVADLDAVMQDNESTLEDIDDAARGAEDAAIDMAKAFAESQGAALNSSTGIDLMIESLYAQALALAPESPLRARLLEYIAELQKIPTNIDTNIRLRVTGQTVTRDGDIIGVRGATPRAEGGFIGRPEFALIGEAGDEAVLPLTKPNRLVELLSDPRIGGPITDAFELMTFEDGSRAYRRRGSFPVDDAFELMTFEDGSSAYRPRGAFPTQQTSARAASSSYRENHYEFTVNSYGDRGFVAWVRDEIRRLEGEIA